MTDTDIRLRAFRATEDKETCQKFMEGHKRVLAIYGIENITTNVDDWMNNPSIFVVVVESMNGEKLFGGVRLQCADGRTPLPIQDAVAKMDYRLNEIIKESSLHGAAEVSGLWNSKEVAGLGIGSFVPTRCTMVLAKQLGIDYIFGLCAPATVRFHQWFGLDVLTEIGNNGTFYYPRLDLVATAVIHRDLTFFQKAHLREREKIFFLRKNLHSVVREKSIFKNMYINLHYDLEIFSSDENEFKLKFKN